MKHQIRMMGLVGLLAACGSDDGGESSASAPEAQETKTIGVQENALDGNGGFLWKPLSDHGRSLVVLLASSYNNRATSVEVHGATPPTETSLLETGTFAGIGNGNRSHYRFSRQGGSYGPNLSLVVRTVEGQITYFVIPNGAHRID